MGRLILVLKVLGSVAFSLATSAGWTSFVTHYWIAGRNGTSMGLLASCNKTCSWLFDDGSTMNIVHPDNPPWFKATQVLMSVGLALGLLSLLIATLSLCCSCRKCNPNHTICVLLILGGLTMGAAVVVFGIQAKEEWSVHLQWDMFANGRFGWSYWVGAAAAGLSLLTGSIYGCMGRRQTD